VSRRGVTLAELLVALALFGVVGGAAIDTVARQWRSRAAMDARRRARAQLVAGADALRAALRMAAAGGDSLAPHDLVAVADTLIELHATVGVSVVCAVVDARTLDLLPASTIAPALAWWLSSPQPGDRLLAHDDAVPGGAWRAASVASVGSSAGGCAGSPLRRAAESGLAVDRVALAAPIAGGVVAGAPVRVTRGVRWVHYRASDGRWYLGAREWDGASWTVTQPVAGPLRAPGARGGLAAVAVDSAGAPIAAALLGSRRVARVDVVLRADVPAAIGGAGAARVDSIVLRVAPRNGG
jgi:prepilin-type N-terminal cleavage/methylation domain-containing protein